MALQCKGCNHAIQERQHLKCNNCKNDFHLDCGNVTMKRFCLMTPENKNNWKCSDCYLVHTKVDHKVTTPSNFVTNQRPKYKINVSVENSFQSLSGDEDSSLSSDENPNTICTEKKTENGKEDLQSLKSHIAMLADKLKLAEKEIENLRSVNILQRKKIAEYEKGINTHTDTCKPDSRKRKKRISLNKTKIDFTRDESSSDMEQGDTMTDTPLSNKRKQCEKNQNNTQRPPKPEHIPRDIHRIHIYADDQGHGLCRQLTNLLGDAYKVCSDIKPGASTDNILSNIISECIDYGKSDYIVILTGENDRSILKLNSYLYYKLSQLTNTNIILCEPRRNKIVTSEKLSETYKLISEELPHVKYIDLRYSYLGIPLNNFKHVCQNVLQEILRIEYNDRTNAYRAKHVHNMLRNYNYNDSLNTNCPSAQPTNNENLKTSCDPISPNGQTAKKGVEPNNTFFRG